MADQHPITHLDRQLGGQPRRVGPLTLEPVFRLTGEATRDPDSGELLSAQVRLKPVAALVRQPGAPDRRIGLFNGTARLIGGLLASGLAIMLACQWLIRQGAGKSARRPSAPPRAAFTPPPPVRREYDVPF